MSAALHMVTSAAGADTLELTLEGNHEKRT